MKDLPDELKKAREELDRLSDQINHSEKTSGPSLKRMKKDLDKIKEDVKYSREQAHEMEKELNGLYAKVGGQRKQAEAIGSIINPLYEKIDRLINYFKERGITSFFGGIFIGISMFLLSPHLTGNVIGNNVSNNLGGAIFFVFGVGLTLFSFIRKNKFF